MTKLQKLYRQYNDKYFGGTLPVPAVVIWSKKVGDLLGDEDYYAIEVENIVQSKIIIHVGIIRLNPIIKQFRSITSITLLHEMVHLYLDVTANDDHQIEPHGEAFQKEMLRLATEGAFKDLW